MRTILVPIVFVLAQSCGGTQAHSLQSARVEPTATDAPSGSRASPPTTHDATANVANPEHDAMLEWIRTKLPPGGEATRDGKGALVVTHTGGAKETVYTLAKSYVELTSVYLAADLATRIAKTNGVSLGNPSVAGKKVIIPDILEAPFKSPEEERLAWPDDHALRAIYLGGRDTLASWESTLDHLKARDMNAVILDGKAYMGDVTYASKVDVAVRDGAIRGAPIEDLSRTIRFAHLRGVRVIMRVSCFHDPWSAVKAPELSVKGYWGGPYPIGWLDPGNEATQKYIFDLIEEVIALGADEINLDYVRYPVQGGLGNADFHLKDTGRTRLSVITDFVKKAHAITQAHHVPLSVDIFGVTATGTRQDMDALGQDIALLSPNVEVLMPMVYPSHYDKGYYGWAEPGNHPEIIAIGTKAAIEKAVTGKAIVRPWLQAFNWKSPEYSPKYLAQETVEAKRGGGYGYAMWNPGGYYGDAWTAIPPVKKN
jgi:hypothetical protein